MMQLKLTPTFNDQAQARHIAPEHEPPGESQWQRPLITINEQASEQTVNKPVSISEIPLKVALIGTAPSSRMLAPYSDPSWKIWACSPGNMGIIPRVDAWFEIHGNLLWPENKHYGEPYINWLKQQTFPIYMQNQELVPNATPLPKKQLVKEFGPYFFTSSFSWMIAFAMVSGAKEIALYGIDMASRDEYILQRPGAYYFFEEAKKRGIKMSAPYESDIMQPPGLYGFSEVTQFGRKMLARKVELEQRVRDLRAQRDGSAQQVTYLEGALEDLDYFHTIFGGAQDNSLTGD
jgi:hypothetical protein